MIVKKITSIITCLICLNLTINAQTFTASIQNQVALDESLTFDIYLLRTGATELNLGNSDFVITFNNEYFSSPDLAVVQLGQVNSALSNNYSVSSSVVSDRLTLNIMPPEINSTQDFNDKIETISNTDIGTLIAKLKVTGISNPNGTAGLLWRTVTLNNTVIGDIWRFGSLVGI